MFQIIEPIKLNEAHREHLKEMIKELCDYNHFFLGGEYVSLSRSPKSSFDIEWYRMHWIEFLLRVVLREIHQRGIYSKNWQLYDNNWMAGMTMKIIIAVQDSEHRRPVVLFYEEYLKVERPSRDK